MKPAIAPLLKPLLIGGAGCVLALCALAAEAPPTTLAVAMEQAWRLAPQAAAMDGHEAAARAAVEVAAGLTPEPGSISIGSLSDRVSRHQGKQEYELELAVPLWLPGQKAAHAGEAATRIDEALARRAAGRLEISGELRQAWWALAAARGARDLARRRVDTARALETAVVRRYRAGELSRIEANLVQSETHAAQAELIEADTRLLQSEQALHILTGAPAPTPLNEEAPSTRTWIADSETDSDTDSDTEAGAEAEPHPVLQAAAATARRARAQWQVAGESRRAAPELALRVTRERGDFTEPYSNSIGIKLKIPFSSDSHVRRESTAAQAEADQAEADLRRARIRVRQEILRAQQNLISAERQLVLAHERRQLAADTVRLTEKSFSLGEADLASLLRQRAAGFDAEAFFDRQRVARAAAISGLNQALGVLP